MHLTSGQRGGKTALLHRCPTSWTHFLSKRLPASCVVSSGPRPRDTEAGYASQGSVRVTKKGPGKEESPGLKVALLASPLGNRESRACRRMDTTHPAWDQVKKIESQRRLLVSFIFSPSFLKGWCWDPGSRNKGKMAKWWAAQHRKAGCEGGKSEVDSWFQHLLATVSPASRGLGLSPEQ